MKKLEGSKMQLGEIMVTEQNVKQNVNQQFQWEKKMNATEAAMYMKTGLVSTEFKVRNFLFITVTLLVVVSSSHAGVVLAPWSMWEYTDSAPSADWKTTAGLGNGWLSGQAPFGTLNPIDNPGFLEDFHYNTYWAGDYTSGNTDLWVRTQIDLTGYDLSTIEWGLGVDNRYELYINGNYVDGDGAEGHTFRWEYTGTFDASLLNDGINVIAVQLDDWHPPGSFDMQVTGVPEPATMLLLGLGGLVLRKRKS